MASSVRKDSKRIEAARRLEEAGKLLAQAGKKMVSAARALELVEDAGVRVAKAARIAGPTTFSADEMDRDKPKTLRDGLPANLRRKIGTEQRRLGELAAEVRAVPVTREQMVLTRANRHRAAKGGDQHE